MAKCIECNAPAETGHENTCYYSEVDKDCSCDISCEVCMDLYEDDPEVLDAINNHGQSEPDMEYEIRTR
jgi:hypothetical protein